MAKEIYLAFVLLISPFLSLLMCIGSLILDVITNRK